MAIITDIVLWICKCMILCVFVCMPVYKNNEIFTGLEERGENDKKILQSSGQGTPLGCGRIQSQSLLR